MIKPNLVVATLLFSINCLALQTDFCNTLNSAMSALGTTGGVVDMRSVNGIQACLTDPFSTPSQVAGPITLLLGNITINVTAVTFFQGQGYTAAWAWRVPSNISILGVPSGVPIPQSNGNNFGSASGTVINFVPTSPVYSAIALVGGQVDLGYFTATGNADVGRLVDARGQSYVRIHNLSLSTASFLPPSGPNAGIAAGIGGTDVWITDNTITQIGPSTVAQGTGDIYIDDAVSPGNLRYHIRNNQISGSHTNVSITCLDCVDSDAIGNQVDQNNKIRSDTNTSGGYGIMFYQGNVIIQNARIENNNITNTAGSGIYCASCTHTSIANNTVSHVAQQESDVSLPVGCVSVNGFDHGAVVGNVCYGSVKDGFDVVSGGYSSGVTGSVFSGNTAHNIAGTGFNIRGIDLLQFFIVNGNTVDQISGASGNAFSIYPGTRVQYGVITNNLSTTGAYNLGACPSCLIANNF